MYVLEWRTFSALTRGLFLCLFPEGNKYKNITGMSAETVRGESTYIILFLTGHNVSINDDKNDELPILSPCLTRLVFVLLMTSQSIADDVKITRQYSRQYLCWALQRTNSTQRPGSPKNTTQQHDVSVQSTLDRRPIYYSQKMDPSSPNANSIMWTHTSLEINIKFKIK